MQVTFHRDPSVPTETSYQYRRAVERKKGAEIETDVFFQDRYRRLSAVLYSHVDAGNPARRLGDDFILIHNPRALVPVPDMTIRRGREYWVRESGDVFSLDSIVHE